MKTQNLSKVAVLAMATAALTFNPAANAANIGFVVGSDGIVDKTFDQGWVSRLTLQGHTVTAVPQNTAANSPSLASLNLFIVSSDVGSGTFLSGVGIAQPKPMLTYEYAVYDDIFGVTGNGNATGLLTNGITISDPLDPLSAGLSGNVSIYTGSSGNGEISKYTGLGSSWTKTLAVSADFPVNAVFAVLDRFQIGGGGNPAPALRIAVPVYDNWDPALVTADGWKLLDGAVAYALVPEPSSFALLGLGMSVMLARRQRG